MSSKRGEDTERASTSRMQIARRGVSSEKALIDRQESLTAPALHKTRLGLYESGLSCRSMPRRGKRESLTPPQRWYRRGYRARLRLTLTVRVILLGRLRLALRQYNLTLELLKLRVELVQLAVRLLHDRRHVGERFTIGRDFPQLLGAGLYFQLLQQSQHTVPTLVSRGYRHFSQP